MLLKVVLGTHSFPGIHDIMQLIESIPLILAGSTIAAQE